MGIGFSGYGCWGLRPVLQSQLLNSLSSVTPPPGGGVMGTEDNAGGERRWGWGGGAGRGKEGRAKGGRQGGGKRSPEEGGRGRGVPRRGWAEEGEGRPKHPQTQGRPGPSHTLLSSSSSIPPPLQTMPLMSLFLAVPLCCAVLSCAVLCCHDCRTLLLPDKFGPQTCRSAHLACVCFGGGVDGDDGGCPGGCVCVCTSLGG